VRSLTPPHSLFTSRDCDVTKRGGAGQVTHLLLAWAVNDMFGFSERSMSEMRGTTANKLSSSSKVTFIDWSQSILYQLESRTSEWQKGPSNRSRVRHTEDVTTPSLETIQKSMKKYLLCNCRNYWINISNIDRQRNVETISIFAKYRISNQETQEMVSKISTLRHRIQVPLN
jgi:hypothetical protein